MSVASRPSQLSDVLSDFESGDSKLNASFRSERTVTTIDDICKALRELEESDSIRGEKKEEEKDKPAPKSAWSKSCDHVYIELRKSLAFHNK